MGVFYETHLPVHNCCKNRSFLIAAYALGHFAAMAVSHLDSRAVSASADGNWGLSFQQEGEPPVANASAGELAEYDAFMQK